jgi:glycosyltransferase involved in cell wall biosynthesis
MKHVFFLTKNYPPEICGVGDYTAQLVDNLQANNFSYGAICAKNDAVLERKRGHVNIYPVIARWNRKMPLELLSFLKAHKPEAICIQYVPYSFSNKGVPFYLILLIILIRLSGVRVYVFFHEVRNRISLRKVGFNKSIIGLLQMSIAYALCFAARPIGTTTKLYQSFLKPFNVPVWPVTSNFGQLSSEEEVGTFGYSNSEKRIVVFSNRLSEAVLNALAYVYKSGVKFRLHVVGYIEKERRISQQKLTQQYLPNEYFLFHTDYDNEFIASVIKEAYLYIHHEPIDEYGEGGISTKSGLVLAAFAYGRCLVGTCGDMTDESFFRSNENYICANFLCPADLSAKLSYLLLNPEKTLSVGRNAYQSYKGYSSFSILSKRYTDFFSNEFTIRKTN